MSELTPQQIFDIAEDVGRRHLHTLAASVEQQAPEGDVRVYSHDIVRPTEFWRGPEFATTYRIAPYPNIGDTLSSQEVPSSVMQHTVRGLVSALVWQGNTGRFSRLHVPTDETLALEVDTAWFSMRHNPQLHSAELFSLPDEYRLELSRHVGGLSLEYAHTRHYSMIRA